MAPFHPVKLVKMYQIIMKACSKARMSKIRADEKEQQRALAWYEWVLHKCPYTALLQSFNLDLQFFCYTVTGVFEQRLTTASNYLCSRFWDIYQGGERQNQIHFLMACHLHHCVSNQRFLFQDGINASYNFISALLLQVLCDKDFQCSYHRHKQKGTIRNSCQNILVLSLFNSIPQGEHVQFLLLYNVTPGRNSWRHQSCSSSQV